MLGFEGRGERGGEFSIFSSFRSAVTPTVEIVNK